MPDVKISALPATTSVAITDILPVVTDPGGTPASEKITVDNFQKSLTTVGKVDITQPATVAVITVADGVSLSVPANATISGTNTGDQTITLTGDVTGTGPGSFATTIANNAVTNAKMADNAVNTAEIVDGAVTEAKQTLADNTTNNVSTTKHGYVPKAPNNAAQVLLGNATWGAVPAPTDISCRVYQTGVTGLTSSWVACAFAAENFDTDTMHDNVTNNTRITFKTAGKYLVGGNVGVTASAVAGARIRVDGTTVIASNRQGNGGNPEGVSVQTIYEFTAGQYIEIQGYAGSSQNTTGDATTNAYAFKLA